MDLSNVVFIEYKPSKRKAKTEARKKRDSNEKKASKKVPLKARKVKHSRSYEKPNKTASKNPNNEREALPNHWTKVPPKGHEPKTKRYRGKIYHWCPHCNYWALHKPGKGKRCQAVDPLGHLLNYFGGKNSTENNAKTAIQSRESDHVSMDDVSL